MTFKDHIMPSSFDSSYREKYDADKMNAVSLMNQKLLQKTLFNKKLLSLEFLLSKRPTRWPQVEYEGILAKER